MSYDKQNLPLMSNYNWINYTRSNIVLILCIVSHIIYSVPTNKLDDNEHVCYIPYPLISKNSDRVSNNNLFKY